MTPAADPVSVYLHLPWCVRKCPYCDFNSHTAGDLSQREAYLDALLQDLTSEAERVAGRSVATVFIGGGTPSLFSPAEIGRLLDGLAAALPLEDSAEVTMEANPGTVERGSMAGYRTAGVNRISLGAQSFDDATLRRLGRIHSADDIRAASQEIRAAGFERMNLDVMYALPGQSLEAAIEDVKAALALDPGHLSHYQLTLEPNTVFSARPPAGLPDAELAWDMQEACHAELSKAGYRQYEVSAFARPAQECRHNLNYWRFGEYLGIGAGAHGLYRSAEGVLVRTRKAANPRQYIEGIKAGDATSERQVAANDAVFEFMLNVLRLPDAFRAADFEARTGLPAVVLRDAVAPAVSQGLLTASGDDEWRTTAQGYRFLNDLQALFLPSENT